MLLKVRSAIPRLSMPSLPLSMSDVDLTLQVLPSASTILLSLLAVFILTSFVRALVIGLREHMALVKQKRQEQANPVPAQSLSTPSEKSSPSVSPAPARRRPTIAWVCDLLRWQSFSARGRAAQPYEQPSFLNEKSRWSAQPTPSRRPPIMSQVNRRNGPAFDRPLPTLYESDIPVSMAKMIMSRHTFRRPSSRPPPARSTTSVQIQRKSTLTLLPPQATSSLSRPTSPPSRSPSPPSPSSSRSSSRSPSPPRASLSPPPSPPSGHASIV